MGRPRGLGHGTRCAPALLPHQGPQVILLQLFYLTVHLPPKMPRRLAPAGTGISQGRGPGRGLREATRQVGSEAELASGYKSQLLPESSPLPLPLFLELGPPPLSSCGGRNGFIFLPLTLGCSVASSSINPLSLGKEKSEAQLGQMAPPRDLVRAGWSPDDLKATVCGCVGSSSCLCKPQAVTEMNSFLPGTIAGGVPSGSWKKNPKARSCVPCPSLVLF